MGAVFEDFPGDRPGYDHRVDTTIAPGSAGDEAFAEMKLWLAEEPFAQGSYEIRWRCVDVPDKMGWLYPGGLASLPPLTKPTFIFTDVDTATLFKLRFG